MTSEISLELEDRVRRDLAAFADTRSEIELQGSQFTWTWKRRRRNLTISAVTDGGLTPERVLFEGRDFGYADFFASEEMAALSWLSEEIERSLRLVKSTYPTETIPAKVRLEDDGEITTFEHALDGVVRQDATRTSLVFLQGRAGDGKSTSLIDLAHKQAGLYASGQSKFLYLYIDAQGRALSRLDEAVALILDDLNANFRYQALAVLTRLGLVVPVVDGFDELLGSGGYAEAFASLESFLFRLEGQGAVVTSARSTFYQQSALSRAAARLSSAATTVNIEIHNIHLLPWGREATQQLLLKLGVQKYLGVDNASAEALYEAAKSHIGSGSDEVLSSPLLTGAYATLLRDAPASASNGSVVEAAIRALVRREIREKLLSAHGDQILNEGQFEILFAAIAEEMWWQEARTLDEETLLLVAELTLEEIGLEKSKSGALLGRLSSNAVIDLGEGARKLSFRHEIYFSFFLGKYFKESILSDSKKELARLLSRSLVPPTLARQSAWLLKSGAEVRGYLAALANPVSDSALAGIVNSNRGALIAGALKNAVPTPTDLTITQAIFSTSDLSHVVFDQVSFKNCRFDHVDLCGARANAAQFEGCVFNLPLVDEHTAIRFDGLQLGKEIVGLRIRRNGKEETIYRTGQEPELLSSLGISDRSMQPAPSLGERERRVQESVDRVVRFAAKSMYFSENDFENRGFPKDMLPVGARHGIWTPADKQRRGVRVLYRLIKNPDEVAAGALGATDDPDILAFWEELFR